MRSPEQLPPLLSGLSDVIRFTLVLWLITMAGAASAVEQDRSLIEAGRLIYEDGLLPGGEPLRGLRPEGFVMEGRHAACVTCHRRSGMGSVEGNIDNTILVPPVAGPVLFAPARFAASYLDESHHYIPNEAWKRALTRPAYDQQGLARAMRQGVDPAGRQLVAPMPVYDFDDDAMVALTAYLQQLTNEPDPGVEQNTLHLATVVTPQAQPGAVDAVVGVLRRWADTARGNAKDWQLHLWELTGPSETWSAQLLNHYRRQPVFALLSGVGGAEWEPVHRFCEQQRVPCILPAVEVAPDVGDDWYSMYFSSGVDLEARILARYLGEHVDTEVRGANIIQVYSDASGRQAADVFSSRFNEGSVQVTTHRFRITSPQSALKQISAGDILVLWLRPHEVAQLVAGLPQAPEAGRVYLSALLANPEELALPASWKQRVHFVSLFDDLGLQAEIARLRLQRWLQMANLADTPGRRLQADAYVASYLFNEALAEVRDQQLRRPAVALNREHVLEVMETLVNKYDDSTGLVDTDSHVAYYGRMSLGPRQRVAVRGGTVLRYASPDSSKLVPVGKRIVP